MPYFELGAVALIGGVFMGAHAFKTKDGVSLISGPFPPLHRIGPYLSGWAHPQPARMTIWLAALFDYGAFAIDRCLSNASRQWLVARNRRLLSIACS